MFPPKPEARKKRNGLISYIPLRSVQKMINVSREKTAFKQPRVPF